MDKEKYIEKCKEFLDYFDVDYSEDTILLTDGGNSCIANPNSQFAELFGGHSINAVAEFVAKELGKKTKWDD